MDISYAQNMEDAHLALAFTGQEGGVYIDVGGGHPVADNVTFALYRAGWRGIVVEPQANLAALYATVRPRDAVACLLVGDAVGEVEFHVVDRLHGFSTMSVDHARRAETFGATYTTVRKPMTTVAALCAEHGIAELDVLKIDVEGAEAQVIAGADLARTRPKVLVIEAVAPGSMAPAHEGWEPAILAAGYDFILFDNLNRWYVASERPEIAARLKTAPLPWDGVRHMYEIGRAGERADHRDHALAAGLARGLWAALPLISPDLLADLAARGGVALPENADERGAALGRIAAGYDGGQLFDD